MFVHTKTAWFSNKAYHVFASINLSVEEGELIAVVGQVGAGKSSLISAILGELYKRTGSAKIKV